MRVRRSDDDLEARIAGCIGKDPPWQALIETIAAAVRTRGIVLITGETGTGKNWLVRLIHELACRRGRLVRVPCVSRNQSLFEARVYGHVKGGHSTADGARAGAVERAAGGTLHLDEIGELDEESQLLLLELLSEEEYSPLGSDAPRGLSANVVCSTNRPLAEAAANGTFRRDLLFRVASHIRIALPPLRTCPEDVRTLATKRAAELGATLTADAMERLVAHDWPGNARELRATVEALAVLARGRPIDASLVERHGFMELTPAFRGPAWVPTSRRESSSSAEPDADGLADALLTEDRFDLRGVRARLYRRALAKTGGNLAEASRLTGIPYGELRGELTRDGIRRGEAG